MIVKSMPATPGDTWYPEITQAMEQAAVAVCLISADFLSSDFCVKEEVPFLLEKREKAGMLFIRVPSVNLRELFFFIFFCLASCVHLFKTYIIFHEEYF